MAKGKIGWIKLQRDIVDSPVWQTDEPFGIRDAYIDLILMANYEDKQFVPRYSRKAITIRRGQVFTSLEHLAVRWKWGKRRVTTYLNLLEEVGLITKNGTTHGTTITLMDYGESGNRGYTDDTAHDTANDTADDTTNATSDDTDHDTANATRLKKDKKYKNRKKEKEIKNTASQSGVFLWEGEPE
jgi:DNA replication protein DnaD